jgi:cytochrome c
VKTKFIVSALFAVAAASLSFGAMAGGAKVDEEAAKALFKRNDCGKCHAPTRDKKGPGLNKIAKDNAGKADAQKKMVDQLQKSPKVKMLDSGKEEEHKAIDTKNEAEITNLVNWIMTHADKK